MSTLALIDGGSVGLQTFSALKAIWKNAKRQTQFVNASDALKTLLNTIRNSKSLVGLEINVFGAMNTNTASAIVEDATKGKRSIVNSKDIVFLLEGFRNVHNLKKNNIVNLLMNVLVSENNFPKFRDDLFDDDIFIEQIRQYDVNLNADDFKPDRDLVVQDLLGVAFVLIAQAADITRVFNRTTDQNPLRRMVRKQSFLHALLAEQLVTVRFGLTVLLATYTVWLERSDVGRNDDILQAPLRPGLTVLMKEAVEVFNLAEQVRTFNQFVPDESKIDNDPLLFEAAAASRKELQLDSAILIRQYVHYFISHALFDIRSGRNVVRSVQLDAYTLMAQRFQSKDAVIDISTVLPVAFSFMEYLLVEDLFYALVLTGVVGLDVDNDNASTNFKSFWKSNDFKKRLNTPRLRTHIWDKLRNSLTEFAVIAEPSLLLNMVEEYAKVTFFHATTDIPLLPLPDKDIFPNSDMRNVTANIWRGADGNDAPNEVVITELLHGVAAVLLKPVTDVGVRVSFGREPALVLQSTVCVLFQLYIFFKAIDIDMRNVSLANGIDTVRFITVKDAMSSLVVSMDVWKERRGVDSVDGGSTFFERIERYVDTFPTTFRELQRQLQRGTVGRSDPITLWKMGRLLLLFAFELGAPVPTFLREAIVAYLALMAKVLTHGYQNPRPPLFADIGDAEAGLTTGKAVHKTLVKDGSDGELLDIFYSKVDKINFTSVERYADELVESAKIAFRERLGAGLLSVDHVSSNFRTEIDFVKGITVNTTFVRDFVFPHTDKSAEKELRNISTALAFGREFLMGKRFTTDPTTITLTEQIDEAEKILLEYRLLWQELMLQKPPTNSIELARNHAMHANVRSVASTLADTGRTLDQTLEETLVRGPRFFQRNVLALLGQIRTTLNIYTIDFLEGDVRKTGGGRCRYQPDATQNYLDETV
jgi:hypothetical protein